MYIPCIYVMHVQNHPTLTHQIWYSKLRHLHQGRLRDFAHKRSAPPPVTDRGALTVMTKAGVVMSCMESGGFLSPAGAPMDPGAMRTEVRGKLVWPFTQDDLQAHFGPALSLTSCTELVNAQLPAGCGPVLLRIIELPVAVVLRQAQLVQWSALRGAVLRNRTPAEAYQFWTSFVAATVGYSNHRWLKLWLRIARRNPQYMRCLREVRHFTFNNSAPAPAPPRQPRLQGLAPPPQPRASCFTQPTYLRRTSTTRKSATMAAAPAMTTVSRVCINVMAVLQKEHVATQEILDYGMWTYGTRGGTSPAGAPLGQKRSKSGPSGWCLRRRNGSFIATGCFTKHEAIAISMFRCPELMHDLASWRDHIMSAPAPESGVQPAVSTTVPNAVADHILSTAYWTVSDCPTVALRSLLGKSVPHAYPLVWKLQSPSKEQVTLAGGPIPRLECALTPYEAAHALYHAYVDCFGGQVPVLQWIIRLSDTPCNFSNPLFAR